MGNLSTQPPPETGQLWHPERTRLGAKADLSSM